jgi:hypothetical protein
MVQETRCPLNQSRGIESAGEEANQNRKTQSIFGRKVTVTNKVGGRRFPESILNDTFVDNAGPAR